MPTTRGRLPIVCAIAVLLGACATPFGGRGGPPGGGNPGDFSGARCSSVVEQNRTALADASRALALTPPQQVLWENYEASVYALVNDQIRIDDRGARRSALQQIDGKAGAMRRHLALMDAAAASAATLYQSLDEAQKRVADQLLAATVPDLYAATSCVAGPVGLGPGGQGGRGGGPR